VSFLNNELGAKRFELLRELVPAAAASVGFLANPSRPSFRSEVKNATQAAQALGVKLIILNASTEAEIDTAFAEFSRQQIAALLVGSDSLFFTHRDQIVALANRLQIVTIYPFREYVVAGGLISYAPSIAEVFRQAGIYVGKIVKGAKPAELPVLQPTKFDLVINLKTAKALGLTVSNQMQLLADEVISGHRLLRRTCLLLGVKRTWELQHLRQIRASRAKPLLATTNQRFVLGHELSLLYQPSRKSSSYSWGVGFEHNPRKMCIRMNRCELSTHLQAGPCRNTHNSVEAAAP
jgi:hypothetical protein